jgi:CheY-like chemotaxis protein
MAALRVNAVILLVEDRSDDVLLMLRSFERAGIKAPFVVAQDGDEAIQYLSEAGKYSNRDTHPIPDLVLLDLKLPKTDGFEVLQWIRSRPELLGLRVVVLTSSQQISDVNKAYALGANSFLVKPMDVDGLVELSGLIAANWFQWSSVPGPSPGPKRQTSGSTGKNTTVYLREKHSHRFYAGHNQWLPEKANAVDFQRIELAESAAAAERLQGVEIVLVCDEPHCEITLPIVFPGVRRT